MRPEIILHVGTEKTGTTSIQSVLAKSYDNLCQNGYLFPRTLGSPCHIHLTVCALVNSPNHPLRQRFGLQDQKKFDAFVAKTKEDLFEEISQARCKALLLSDEHINAHLINPTSMLNYKKICDEFGSVSKVIIYLRRQDSFRLSLFSEAVKAGSLKAFDTDNPLPEFITIPPRFDYLRIIENLSSVFGPGRVIVRLFEKNAFYDNNIMKDYCKAIGVPSDILSKSSAVENRSLDARILRPLAQIARILKTQESLKGAEIYRFILNHTSDIVEGQDAVMDTQQHDVFMQQFREQNSILKNKYFPEIESGDLFACPPENLQKKDRVNTYPECSMSNLEFLAAFAKKIYGVTMGELAPEDRTEVKPSNNIIRATCPLCGDAYDLELEKNVREGKLCPHCGASGRSQAIGLFVSRLLFDNNRPLKNQKLDFSKSVVGLSDNRVYAEVLSKVCDYTNTFYHQEPFLDICNPSDDDYGKYDILISADVFEHIIGSPSPAFEGAYSILKPGGYLILTVPYVNKGNHIEHYPEAVNYQSFQAQDGNWIAELEYADGSKVEDPCAKFHGGPGKTLEMRLFNRSRLEDELSAAGFEDILFHTENLPEHGINWGPASRIITARKKVREIQVGVEETKQFQPNTSIYSISPSTPIRVTKPDSKGLWSFLSKAVFGDYVKWRMPSIPGLPNPALVILPGSTVHFDNISVGENQELRLSYGPGLPKISDDGLDISIHISNSDHLDGMVIYQDHVNTGDQLKELWLDLPKSDGPIDIAIECGPGPEGNPTADWLAIAEFVVADRKSYSLARARANKELRTKNEIAHFSRSYRQPMFNQNVKRNAFAHAQAAIQAEEIDNPINFVQRAMQICAEKQLKVLTVCCGAARVEESIFKNVAVPPHITLVDINDDLLNLAADRLKSIAEVSTICGNANEFDLPEKQFDVAICVAGLHHIVELEHLFKQLAKCLSKNGEFWSIGEYVGRNGARLWPESYTVADEIFSSLPAKYRRNNVSAHKPKPVDKHLSNVDCSISSFEGIRAEDIKSCLEEVFIPTHVNQWSTIVWRVIGPAYVDNYDLDNEDDLRIVDSIVQQDIKHFKSGSLKPVGLRGIYHPRDAE